jgi:hypothetical protein
LKKRSLLRLSIALGFLSVVTLFFAGCGKTFYFAGRTLPPSQLTNRVMIAIQNPGIASSGALQIVDAFYDIRHSSNNAIPSFFVSGFSGKQPVTIQNLPEEQTGAVYNSGDGSLDQINYATEKQGSPVAGLVGQSSSVFISRNLNYVVAADQTVHVFTMIDRTLGSSVGKGVYYLNLPGVYRASINPGASVALAFIQDTNDVYSVVHLTQDQQVAASTSPDPQHFQPTGSPVAAQDCEPQSLPQYCAFKLQTPSGVGFDRPVKAIFSADGTSIYVLNCGPECGGQQAGFTIIPITAGSLNGGTATGPSGLNLVPSQTVGVPGGASNAIQNGNTFYLAGQQLQTDGYFSGNLTTLDLPSLSITGTYSISDGNPRKMGFADDSTLWIGSTLCQQGERYHLNPSASTGCLTMFNTANNSVLLDSYKGDATGIAPVTGLHKIYTAEGGQVHIYNTTDGTERDNSNVTVVGTASDVTYMDSTSDGQNTTY